MTLLDDWVQKAESDFIAAAALNRRRKTPVPDVVCYHCQQCAEKYLKAYLLAQGAIIPHIHDLEELLTRCTLYDASLARQMPLALALNPYGILIRYPGLTATVTEAKETLTKLRRLRTVLRRNLGL